MAGGSADIGFGDIEPFQVFKYMLEKEQVEQMLDMIEGVLEEGFLPTKGLECGRRLSCWTCCEKVRESLAFST